MRDDIKQVVLNFIRQNQLTLEKALSKTIGLFGESHAALIGEVEEELRRDLGQISTLSSGALHNTRQPWYLGPQDGDRFWPPLKKKLLDSWGETATENVDTESTRIVSLLDNPSLADFKTKGLVVGHVQSGKTANFTAVISKAADVGYKLFIVMSGMTNVLRQQTQTRIYDDIIAHDRAAWAEWTDADRDFSVGTVSVNTLLEGKKNIAVVKKNAMRLRHLRDYLKEVNPQNLSATPVLIIDDESDQASINSAPVHAEATKINSYIREILEWLPKVGFVGYTATPFANVLIDPAVTKDLYPRDFIHSLPPPAGYFGAEQLFGRDPLEHDSPDCVLDGENRIRSIPQEDIQHLRPDSRKTSTAFTPQITPSLRRSIMYFFLATAIRERRGDRDAHSTMLIHTTVYVAPHQRFKPLLTDFVNDIVEAIDNRDPGVLTELQAVLEEEQEHLPPSTYGYSQDVFSDLLPLLPRVIADTKVVIENSQSDVRLDYSTPGRIYVVVGGNVLARGLTLHGLVVSFFLRTSSAYDSLLQMGRWFGYRDGYEDLPRVWLSRTMQRYFSDLATVEQEIRNDIRRYQEEGLTPLDFGVRIRTHPQLAITARNKMHAAIPCKVAYGGRTVQTILFHHHDSNWLDGNWEVSQRLITRASDEGTFDERLSRPSWLWRDVPVEAVIEFLTSYKVSERSVAVQPKPIREYIARQNELRANGPLSKWNIAVIGGDRKHHEPAPLEGPGGLWLVNRSMLKDGGTDSDTADIKALVGKSDIAIDFPEQVNVNDHSRAQLHNLRSPSGHVSSPLLLLLPISKDSTVHRSSSALRRTDLDADRHVMGMACVFPETGDITPVSYVTVDLGDEPTDDWEDPDYTPEDDM